MQREIIQFTTEAAWLANRLNDLTSSDIPCLFGYGYQTYEQLLNSKKMTGINQCEMNERMQWGVALQDSVAHEFARQNQWNIRKKTEYIRIPSLRLGSSFDYEITTITEENRNIVGVERLLEIKNVDIFQYKREWKVGFEIEATPYVELQFQHQLLVSGIKEGVIGALVGGNQGVLLHREANKKVQDAILIKAEKFWREVDDTR